MTTLGCVTERAFTGTQTNAEVADPVTQRYVGIAGCGMVEPGR